MAPFCRFLRRQEDPLSDEDLTSQDEASKAQFDP